MMNFDFDKIEKGHKEVEEKMEKLEETKKSFFASHEARMKELNEAIDSLNKTSNECNTRITKNKETIDRLMAELENM